MATPVRMFSLEQHLLERLKFSGMDRENLADLAGIISSLSNKYGIVPVALEAQGSPAPDRLVAGYLLEPSVLNKLVNILHDTPRVSKMTLIPRGIPSAKLFELQLTLGG